MAWRWGSGCSGHWVCGCEVNEEDKDEIKDEEREGMLTGLIQIYIHHNIFPLPSDVSSFHNQLPHTRHTCFPDFLKSQPLPYPPSPIINISLCSPSPTWSFRLLIALNISPIFREWVPKGP